jgi:hypothetical protein
MTLYNFTLTLSGVSAHTPGLEDALHHAGCADALVCFYATAVYLEFDRESESLEQAILSAIDNIESASELNARVESVDATLVGLSDIAELTGLSRQAVALLKDGARARKRQLAAVALENHCRLAGRGSENCGGLAAGGARRGPRQPESGPAAAGLSPERNRAALFSRARQAATDLTSRRITAATLGTGSCYPVLSGVKVNPRSTVMARL